jgi:hypothetical protein
LVDGVASSNPVGVQGGRCRIPVTRLIFGHAPATADEQYRPRF